MRLQKKGKVNSLEESPFFFFHFLFLGTVQSILLHPIAVQDTPKSMNGERNSFVAN